MIFPTEPKNSETRTEGGRLQMGPPASLVKPITSNPHTSVSPAAGPALLVPPADSGNRQGDSQREQTPFALNKGERTVKEPQETIEVCTPISVATVQLEESRCENRCLIDKQDITRRRSDHSLQRISSFPAKKRKVEEISALHAALASPHSPSCATNVDDHSAQKKGAYLLAERMNIEIETDLGENFGRESSASPVKPCALNQDNLRHLVATTVMIQEGNEVVEEVAPCHSVLDTSYRKGTPLILPALGPTISCSVPSSEEQERGFKVELDKENPCSPVHDDDSDGNKHPLDIEMTPTNSAITPFGVGNTAVVIDQHKAVQEDLARNREAGTDGDPADVVLSGNPSLTLGVHAGTGEPAEHVCVTGQEDTGDTAARMSVEHVHNDRVLHAMEGDDVTAAAGPCSGTASFGTPAPYPVWGEDPFLYVHCMVDWLRTQRRMVDEETARLATKDTWLTAWRSELDAQAKEVNHLKDMADIAHAAAEEKALTLEQKDKSLQLRAHALEELEEAMKQREHAVAEVERKANEVRDEAVEKIRLVEDRIAEERNKAWQEAEARVELDIQNYVKRIGELQIELENAKRREKDAATRASQAESDFDKAEAAISEMVSKKCDADPRLKKADEDLVIANNRSESAEKTHVMGLDEQAQETQFNRYMVSRFDEDEQPQEIRSISNRSQGTYATLTELLREYRAQKSTEAKQRNTVSNDRIGNAIRSLKAQFGASVELLDELTNEMNKMRTELKACNAGLDKIQGCICRSLTTRISRLRRHSSAVDTSHYEDLRARMNAAGSVKAHHVPKMLETIEVASSISAFSTAVSIFVRLRAYHGEDFDLQRLLVPLRIADRQDYARIRNEVGPLAAQVAQKYEIFKH